LVYDAVAPTGPLFRLRGSFIRPRLRVNLDGGVLCTLVRELLPPPLDRDDEDGGAGEEGDDAEGERL